MKTILCFGDSNTWGHPPIASLADIQPRYGFTERWPGVMRQLLGEGYWVIEEGLSARTSVFDDPVEGQHKNGMRYLLPCLETHAPLDLVTIMLGTNDMKVRFSAPPFDIAWGVAQLAALAMTPRFGTGKPPQVLIICPPRVGKLSAFAELWVGGKEKSEALVAHYRAQAETLGCGFLDAGAVITVSDIDGIHFDKAEHAKLGAAVADKVRQMLA
jgi:lysophospholipase L1-like esterase